MIALPVALVLTAVTPGSERPTMAGMDNLSILLASGQLLGLPIVIYLVARGRFARVPLAMVTILVVHFAPYSWLYATWLYLAMGAAVSVVAVLADATARRCPDCPDADVASAGRVCWSTGVVMLMSAGIAWML